MKILTDPQGSVGWSVARIGVPTASNFSKIITSKGEPSKQATKYMHKLAGEIITGYREELFQSDAMLRGIEMESEARNLYSMTNDVEVEEVGLCLGEGLFPFGASSDGFVGTDGMVEIKCPNMATHVGYLLAKKLPTDYFQQVQGQMWVCNRKWNDFVSYYPALKPLIVRVNRDEEFITKLSKVMLDFCQELSAIVGKLEKEKA